MLGRLDDRLAARWPTAWACWKMSRPSQLLLIAVVYLLGAAIAAARVGPPTAGAVVLGLVPLLPVAASVHYANEYADYETDALTDPTPFSGGSGALQRTGLPRGLALRAAVAALVTGTVVAAASLVAGLSAAAVTVLTVICVLGWQYSLPPLALAWRGYGELDNVLLGALLLPLYGFTAATGVVRAAPVLACLPFAVLVFVNLLETHWPDREADARVGKRTLPTLWSPRRLRQAYVAGIGVYLASLALLTGRALPWQVTLPSLAVLPLLVWGAVRYTHREHPLPAVLAMVALAVLQLAAWGRIAELV